MEDYQYTPLDLEKPVIRLLCLHPGKGKGSICCDLLQAELRQRDNTVSYEALSYTWGSPRLSATIYVNGCCLNITRNLYNALLDLRYPKKRRILWIDAVCIDQGNNKERGHQVGQMGNIYKEAECVIFRLGWGSYMTDLFMESLERLQKESIQHACRAWSRQDSRWEDLWTRSLRPVSEKHDADLSNLRQGLQEILEQPWFRRVWILQEVAFAKAGIISCGKKTVSARLFSLTPLLLGVTTDVHCQSVLDIMPSPWRESSWWNESRSFYKLLFFNFGNSEATDPRDLVYALRGISSDLADKDDDPLFPDYTKSQEKLVHDVVQYFYAFDVVGFQGEPRLRVSSMQELIRNLPIIEADICRCLAEMSQPDHMETILKRSEILVTQDMIKAAAQYDKEGKVVNILLQSRRGEFKIDEEVLLCAAKNLNAAKDVFEAFWRHQNQLITTERVLIATAENSTSGHSAMRFLLSLKTENYRIAPILEAVARNTSEYSRKEIIENLLQQKNNGNNTISDVITAAANTQSYPSKIQIIEILLQQKGNNKEAISEALTAAANIQSYPSRAQIIGILMEKQGNSNDTLSEVLTATTNIQCHHSTAQIFGILLQQKGNSDETISEILTVAAGVQRYGPSLVENFVRRKPGFKISEDAVKVAMRNWRGDTDSLQVLCCYFPYLNSSLKQFA
ncbi:heterokaryon incompatibility protein domain-containing protein [Trichoderma velutinum]